MLLIKAPVNKKLILKSIIGGKGIRKRLIELGMTEGVIFKIIHLNKYGPAIIKLNNCNIALGHNMLKHIEVELQ